MNNTGAAQFCIAGVGDPDWCRRADRLSGQARRLTQYSGDCQGLPAPRGRGGVESRRSPVDSPRNCLQARRPQAMARRWQSGTRDASTAVTAARPLGRPSISKVRGPAARGPAARGPAVRSREFRLVSANRRENHPLDKGRGTPRRAHVRQSAPRSAAFYTPRRLRRATTDGPDTSPNTLAP